MKIVWFALCFFCCTGFCPAVEYDVSYTPLTNGGAEEGMTGWFFEAVASISAECPEGTRCFQFVPSADSSCHLQSALLAVRKGESLQLDYRLKTDSDAVIKKDSACVIVRSYGPDRTSILSEFRFNLQSSNGNWKNFSHHLTVDAGACYVDIKFVYNGTGTDSARPGLVYVDAISIYREIKYHSLYAEIKPLSEGDTLYVFTKGPNSEGNQFIAMQTLQGITARTNRPWLWIDAGDNTFLDDLAANYKIKIDRNYARDYAGLLGVLKDYTSGRYVLYDIRDKPSISAATTMAGLLDAVAIDVRLQETAIAKGYTLAQDVQGKDCRWVYENYRDQINPEAIIVHTHDVRHHRSAYYLKDIGPAVKALSWWYNDDAYSREVFRSMAPCTPVYGWQDATTSDEGLTVKMHSEEGLFQMPSDWMLNLSVFASMGSVLKDRKFTQKASRVKPAKESSVHYVTFILSDMDNILTEIGPNSFYSSPKFYRNSHRGQFPMSWGMAPSLVELAPTGLDLWYKHATPNDVFVAYCGLGYFYPSVAPYLQTHTKRLAEFMDRADLRTLLLIDRLLPERALTNDYYDKAKWFTSNRNLRGLFYLEYIQYAPHNGRIFWFDNKPMVTARFDFRTEQFYPAVRSTAKSLAESINKLPKDPASPDGYTFVTVHAWSKGLNDIHDAVQLLDPSVRVVNAEEFIEQLCQNVKPSK